jgi:hypothetical protein
VDENREFRSSLECEPLKKGYREKKTFKKINDAWNLGSRDEPTGKLVPIKNCIEGELWTWEDKSGFNGKIAETTCQTMINRLNALSKRNKYKPSQTIWLCTKNWVNRFEESK